MDNTVDHYGMWGAVIFWVIMYSLILFFLPFYRKSGVKPKGAFIAFVLAFALEMFGLPFSIYFISWAFSYTFPEGLFWGHTLFSFIGHGGMYLGAVFMLGGLIIIILGWRQIYKKYWSKDRGEGALVQSGIYSLVRHPQYTGLFLITFGMMCEWLTLPQLIFWPVIIYTYVKLARKEEKDMEEEFGTAYAEYCATTGMFFPRIKK